MLLASSCKYYSMLIITCPQDITARSPIVANDGAPTRQSLDSARFPRMPRSSLTQRRFEKEPPTQEENFEDVGLNDDAKQQQPKKRGFFSKFGDSHPESASNSSPTASRFSLISGRKRGQSGQGAELGSMDRPETAGSVETEVQS